MIHTVVSVGLPVAETMNIKKQRLVPKTIAEPVNRICILTGIHGDELEGQYVCYELIRRIKLTPEHLTGVVDIYPSVNPLGMEANSRGIPTFDLDMNRSFPGNEDGDMVERVAAALIKDITGAQLCLDIHASNIFIREIPQVRLTKEWEEEVLPFANLLNIDFIWVYNSTTVLSSTLVHTLNHAKTPAMAIEMGVGTRITKKYGEQLVEGILCVMKELGIWTGSTIQPKKPIVSKEEEVVFLHAEASGIFLPRVEHWKGIKKGDIVGEVINPYLGKVEEKILSPCDGMVFSLREYPVVYTGALLARILGGTCIC